MSEQGGRYGMARTNFLDEDIEDASVHVGYRDGVLEDKELLEFVEKHVTSKEGHPEYYRTIMQDMFSNTNLVSSTMWVENPVTGAFAAVSTGSGASNTLSDNPDRGNIDDENKRLEDAPSLPHGEGKEYPDLGKKAVLMPPNPIRVTTSEADDMQQRKSDEWTLVTMEYRNFAFIRRLGFLIFQGLLGGFAVVTVYVRTSAPSDEDSAFLHAYEPIANEVRRYFYILTALAFTGSIDYFYTTLSAADARYSLIEYLSANIASKWMDFQKVTLTTSLVVMVLYGIAFLMTLIMSRFDVLVYRENGITDTDTNVDWTTLALDDSTFNDRLSQWKVLDQVRLATVLLAWLGCCLLLWMDISRYSKLWMNLRTMRTTALSWMRRAKALEGGKELDNMTAAELKELVAALEIGLQRSKGALSLKEDIST